ncbi:MAG: putative glycoside hydrolase [Patescibacteria group bacterium]
MIRLWREGGSTRTTIVIVAAFIIVVGLIVALWRLPLGRITYTSMVDSTDLSAAVASSTPLVEVASSTPVWKATHLDTPEAVRAVYMTSWAAGSQKFRKHLFDLVDTTEINAVVIDVKDYTGRIAFDVDDPMLIETGAVERRIPDVKELIEELHKKGVYVIGRVSVFQDSYLINVHPEWAVKTKAGEIWKDYKGVKWLDAAAKPVWDYAIAIGHAAYDVGFDELNFDYVRFPSDGNLEDIAYTWAEGKQRSEVMKGFFEYVHNHFSGTGIPTSVDFFGLTTSAEGDLGIGQILEHGLEYFDYVAPMVYPSHYGKGFLGYTKPAQYPYEVIASSMGSAIAKAEATTTRSAVLGVEPIASTTPQLYTKKSYDKRKLRPWFQAFDLGAVYTPEMVRKQIEAAHDLGLDSWMLWDAASVYDKNDLLPK